MSLPVITRHDLDRFCPRPKAAGPRQAAWDGYAEAIEQAAPMFEHIGIDDELKLCHVLAQWGAETGGFTIMWESGNYTAKGILNTFGKGKHSAAVTRDEADEIASLPTHDDMRAKALFERVYGLGNPHKANELGNIEEGDGYRYRGYGIQQITGRHDHERYLEGDYTPIRAVEAALMEWRDKRCNDPAGRDDCLAVTRKINGGTNGLAQRRTLLAQAKEIWLTQHDDNVTCEHDDDPNTLLQKEPPKPVTQSKSILASIFALIGIGTQQVSTLKASFDQVQQASSDVQSMGLLSLPAHHFSNVALVGGMLAIAAVCFVMRERIAKLAEGI